MRVIGGVWSGLSLDAPQGRETTRPTTDRVRESLTSMVLSASGLSFAQKCVLDCFAGSSAYYLRYMDPHNEEALVAKDVAAYWQNVDLYVLARPYTRS